MASNDTSMMVSEPDLEDISREPAATSSNILSVDTVTSPIVASNQIVLNAGNSTECKLVGIHVEEHHHYGSTDSDARKEQLGNTFQLDRNALTKLISKYKEEEGWMYPLPWEKTLKLEPEEFYVELTLDAFSKSGLYSKGAKAKVEEVFEPVLPDGLPIQRVLIQGNAGFGKSSICQKVVYDWSHGITTLRTLPWQSSLPVLFKLRFLDEESNLEVLILEFIGLHYFPQHENQNHEFFIQSLGRNLIIILDGYDELGNRRQKHVQKILESWKREDSVLSNASLLVTTRPTTDEKFLLMFEKHYFITNISDNNVELLIRKFKPYTRSIMKRHAYKIDKFLATFSGFPKTRLLEKCLFRQTGKDIQLKDMPPLMIALICWVVSQPQDNFRSKDFIYNCLELLSMRCNERENFDLTEENIDEIMFRFGLVCIKTETTVMAESLLKKELGSKMFSFLALTGILKCSESPQGITVWEPVYKSFIDALVERTLFCDGMKTLSSAEVRAFLSDDITSISCDVVLHATQEGNICFKRLAVRFTIGIGLRYSYLNWNHRSSLRPFTPHSIEVGGSSRRAQKLMTFNSPQLKTFALNFLSMLTLVKNDQNIQEFLHLHVYNEKPHVFSCALDNSADDTLELTINGTRYDSLQLLSCRDRGLSFSKSTDSQNTSVEEIPIRKPQRETASHIKTIIGKRLSFSFLNLLHTINEWDEVDKRSEDRYLHQSVFSWDMVSDPFSTFQIKLTDI